MAKNKNTNAYSDSYSSSYSDGMNPETTNKNGTGKTGAGKNKADRTRVSNDAKDCMRSSTKNCHRGSENEYNGY